MSHRRSERIGDLILGVLARAIREELRDPRVGFVTLTEVVVSPDLKHARIYLSTLDQDPAPVLQALNRAEPFLRHCLAREGGLRFTPRLRFLIDESIAGGQRVDKILEDLDPGDAGDTGADRETSDEDAT